MSAPIQGYNPYYYRNFETEIEKNIKNHAAKKPGSTVNSSFLAEMNKHMSPSSRQKLSSDILSKTLSREKIREHISDNPERKKLYHAAEQFEAFFIEKMFKEMKKTIGKKGLIDGGFAEEVFDEMLLTERVGQMAHQGEFGLAEKIYQQMQRL